LINSHVKSKIVVRKPVKVKRNSCGRNVGGRPGREISRCLHR